MSRAISEIPITLPVWSLIDDKATVTADVRETAVTDGEITGTTEDLMAKFDQEPMFDTSTSEQPATAERSIEQTVEVTTIAPAPSDEAAPPQVNPVQVRKPTPRRVVAAPPVRATPKAARVRTVRRAIVQQPHASTGYAITMPSYTGSIRRY